MNNLYVFAIGGTGERVMKSFVMMLAAGVKVGASQVRPVFIDNDAESRALTDCKEIIESYRNERYGFHHLCTQFNGNSFAQTEIAEPIVLDRAGGSIGNLSRMIKGPDVRNDDPEYEKKNEEINSIMAERDLLFTLAADMTYYFSYLIAMVASLGYIIGVILSIKLNVKIGKENKEL